MKALLMVLGAIVLYPLLSIWYGYVLSILWAWFIVSTFHTVTLSIPLAIGVSMVLRLFTNQSSSSTSDDEKKAKDAFLISTIASFLYPLFALIVGAIVHAFI